MESAVNTRIKEQNMKINLHYLIISKQRPNLGQNYKNVRNKKRVKRFLTKLLKNIYIYNNLKYCPKPSRCFYTLFFIVLSRYVEYK